MEPAEPLAAVARGLGALALDALLPGRCLRCGAIVGAAGALCAACWDAMSFIAPPLCARCGQPFEVDPMGAVECAACLAEPPAYRRARAVFRYDAASRDLILRFKHADRTSAAPHMAQWMARAGAELLAEADAIVPVPLHRWRLWRRRYNQAALLALALARLAGKPCIPDALVRVRATPSQGLMGRSQRRRNVRGAFHAARGADIAGRRVLLIDDVLTSGATVDECVRALERGGAECVDVLTLARVVLAPDYENAPDGLYS